MTDVILYSGRRLPWNGLPWANRLSYLQQYMFSFLCQLATFWVLQTPIGDDYHSIGWIINLPIVLHNKETCSLMSPTEFNKYLTFFYYLRQLNWLSTRFIQNFISFLWTMLTCGYINLVDTQWLFICSHFFIAISLVHEKTWIGKITTFLN